MAKSAFERHKIITLIVINFLVFAVIIIGAEIYLRINPSFADDYYGFLYETGWHKLPYGDIYINEFEYPDEEFDLSTTEPRIGYLGDSVNFGLGAGYPFRVSEIVETAYPDFAHWNVGAGIAAGIRSNRILERTARFDLDTVVYLMNLNDVVRAGPELDNHDSDNLVHRIKGWLKPIDWLRQESRVYSTLRFIAKNALQRMGYGHTGLIAYELYPDQYKDVFSQACSDINEVTKTLNANNVDLCVILLPYEMQVSNDAAAVYKDLGFKWEQGFVEGSAQTKLKSCLATPYIYDAREAFDPATGKVGEYFVYNRGDKIDWNHPNRKGHAAIADGFIDSQSCPFLTQPSTNSLN